MLVSNPWRVTGLALAAVLSALVLQTEGASGLWLDLSAGRDMLRSRTLQLTDWYTHTHQGAPIVNVEWLRQALTYVVYAASGLAGVTLLKLLAALAAYGAMLATRKLHRWPAAAAALTLLAILTAQSRLHAMDDLVALLALAVLNKVLHDARAGSTKRLAWTVPIMILWANMGSVAIFGSLLIAIHAGGAIALHLSGANRWQHIGAWAAAALGGALALALTPYGGRGVVHAGEWIHAGLRPAHAVDPAVWAPLWSAPIILSTLAGTAFLLVAILLAALAPRALKPVDWVLLVGCVMLAATTRRFAGPAALICTPWMTLAAVEVSGRLKAHLRRRRAGAPDAYAIVLRTGLCVACLVVVVDTVTNRLYARDGRTTTFGIGIDRAALPASSAAALAGLKAAPRLYNSARLGGYLTWHLYPAQRTYVDERQHFEDAFLASDAERRTIPASLPVALADEGVDVAHVDSEMQPLLALLRSFADHPDWMLYHASPTGAIFVRPGLSAEPRGAEQWELVNPVQIEIDQGIRYTEMLLALGLVDHAVAVGEQLRQKLPNSPSTAALFGQLALATGHPDLAAHNMQAALEHDPKNALHWARLAEATAASGDSAQALRPLSIAYSLDPRNPRIHRLLGTFYLNLGRPTEALQHFDQAIQARPSVAAVCGQASAFYALGRDHDAIALLDTWQEDIPGLERQARALRTDCLERIANRAHAAGQLAQAAEACEAALLLLPDRVSLHRTRARVALDQADAATAALAARQALELDPGDPDTLLLAARAEARLGHVQEALEAITAAIDTGLSGTAAILELQEFESLADTREWAAIAETIGGLQATTAAAD